MAEDDDAESTRVRRGDVEAITSALCPFARRRGWLKYGARPGRDKLDKSCADAILAHHEVALG
eukprot:4495457-Pyramimonas_sp.AAC.1